MIASIEGHRRILAAFVIIGVAFALLGVILQFLVVSYLGMGIGVIGAYFLILGGIRNHELARAIRLIIGLGAIILIAITALNVYEASVSSICYQEFCQGDRIQIVYPLIYPVSTLPATSLHPVGQFPGLNATDAMDIELTVNSSVPIVEGTEVRISGVGAVTPHLAGTMKEVSVSFPGAIPYAVSAGIGGTYTLGNGFGITLTTNITNDQLEGPPADLAFAQQGSYPAVLTIVFNNGTSPIQAVYQGLAVSVLSSQVLQTQRFNQVTLALTYALVGFGFLEAINIAMELNSRRASDA